MALLDREKLLTKEELKVEKVMLNRHDFVYVRQMTGRERVRFEQSLVKEVKDGQGNVDYERSLEDFRAKLAVNTVCDEKGNNLLQPGNYPVLSQNMSAPTLEELTGLCKDAPRFYEVFWGVLHTIKMPKKERIHKLY